MDAYYKLDGSTPLRGDFNAGYYKLRNVADGVLYDDAATINQLNTKADKNHIHDEYYNKNEYINKSSGTLDANNPIVTGPDGKLDSSLIPILKFTYHGAWGPIPSDEYPDTTGIEEGIWIITLGSGTDYTFQTGELRGQTVDNGDIISYTTNNVSQHWFIIPGNAYEGAYYRLDGSLPLTGPFAGGGHQLKNIAHGTAMNDAVTKYQLEQKSDKTHTHDITDIPGLPDKLMDLSEMIQDNTEDIVDLAQAVQIELDNKEDYLGTPAINGYVLASDANGDRYWIPNDSSSIDTFLELTDTPGSYTGQENKIVSVKGDGTGLEFIDKQIVNPVTEWGDIIGDITKQTDLVQEFDKKFDKTGGDIRGDINIIDNEPTLKFLDTRDLKITEIRNGLNDLFIEKRVRV